MTAGVEPIRLDVTDEATATATASLAVGHVAAGLPVICIASLGAARTMAFNAKPHPKGAAMASPTSRLSGIYGRADRLDVAMVDAVRSAFKGLRADHGWR